MTVLACISFGADVDRCAHGEAQALPLADGVPHSAAVGAYLSAADVEEIARRVVLAGEILHKAGVVAASGTKQMS